MVFVVLFVLIFFKVEREKVIVVQASKVMVAEKVKERVKGQRHR